MSQSAFLYDKLQQKKIKANSSSWKEKDMIVVWMIKILKLVLDEITDWVETQNKWSLLVEMLEAAKEIFRRCKYLVQAI